MSLSPPETTDAQEISRSLDTALAAVMTRAGIDPDLEVADLQEALHRAIALRRCSCTWTQICTGFVVTLQYPEPHRFFGETLEDALAWCLAWVMDQEARTTSQQVMPGSARSDVYGSQQIT